MFGKNEIVGKKFFHSPDHAGKLLITSIFLTIQGEGPFAGRPAVFVRLAKCNLACHFCDTYFDSGDWMDTSEVVQRMFDTIAIKYGDVASAPRVGAVITGGEPTLQPMLGELCRRLSSAGMAFVQIETNGILAPDDLGAGTCIVCSPKCAQSHEGKPLGYTTPHALTLEMANCLKFVVTADSDSPYHEIPGWAHEWARDNRKYIYITPMNCYVREPLLTARLTDGHGIAPTLAARNAAEVISFWEPEMLNMGMNRLNYEYAARYALDHGYFLCIQIHLFAGLA